jgi:hypothetical protein
MTTFGIRDPRIAAGFGALSNAMFPNAMDTVRASVLGAQREMINSRAGLYGAQTQAQVQDTEGARRMSEAILQNGVDFSQQHNRAAVAAGAALRSNPVQGMTAGAMGMGMVSPNMPDLSRILTAGGIQSFQNTPQGFAETNARVLEQSALDRASRENVARIGNEGSLAVANVRAQAGGEGGGQARNYVSPMDSSRFNEAVLARLTRQYNEQNRASLTPETMQIEEALRQRIVSAAEREYMNTGRFDDAITNAMAGLPTEFNDNRGFIFGANKATARLRAGGANPAPSGGGGTGTVGSAQAAPAAAPTASPENTVIEGPGGQRLVKRNGQWTPLQ